ncbi:MAG: hypothetical protein JWN86_4474 [Planctomycetota bacterium]|nr:hypothetical protein [Planctomycetota bacterium]
MPRFRFTVRRMMVVVAVVAVLMGLLVWAARAMMISDLRASAARYAEMIERSRTSIAKLKDYAGRSDLSGRAQLQREIGAQESILATYLEALHRTRNRLKRYE